MVNPTISTTSLSDNSVSNKGVNVDGNKYLDSTSSACTCSNPPSRSLTDIKNEIQTVLDLMGPSTPHLTTSMQNTSSEADNEESLMSIAHSKSGSERKQSPCRRTESVMADAGSCPSNNLDEFDNVKCPCYEYCYVRHPSCPCMMNMINSNPIPCVAAPGTEGTTNQCASKTTNVCNKKRMFEWLKGTPFDLMLRRSSQNPCELYKINMSGQDDDGHPKRVVFDLVEGIPKPSVSTVATNTIKKPVERTTTSSRSQFNRSGMKSSNGSRLLSHPVKYVFHDSEGNRRVDYYYFDHGNAEYLNTTDTPPEMFCEILAEKTERYTTKFWAEFFASIHIGVSFCISFVLQLFKFLLYSVIRPMTVGLMQLTSDYLYKPFLTTFFNGLIQPSLIFFYNIATSIRDLCDPVAEGVGYFLRELAVLCRSIRLCTYRNTCDDSCECTRCNGSKRKCYPKKCEC